MKRQCALWGNNHCYHYYYIALIVIIYSHSNGDLNKTVFYPFHRRHASLDQQYHHFLLKYVW